MKGMDRSKLWRDVYKRQDKGIPQMILAGASVDDVFVIVLFTSFTGMAQGGSFSPAALAGVPVSIVLGLSLIHI